MYKSHMAFPLVSSRSFLRHEQARKGEQFLSTILTSTPAPVAVIYKPSDHGVYVQREDAACWFHPLRSEDNFAPLKSVSSALYVGELANTSQHVFVTDEQNVDEQYLGQLEVRSLRSLLGLLADVELTALAVSASMLSFATSTRFCARCGAATQLRDLGLSLRCTACPNVVYPPVSPAMIVAVLDGAGRVILSQRQRAPREGQRVMRTVLSGFVSPGESLEDTVAREVEEETGAKVSAVRYVGSQPWPFPSELMLGFYAVADSSAPVVLEAEELVQAAWTTKEEVRRALAGEHEEYVLPPPFTAAHVLIAAWANGLVDDYGNPR